MPVTPDNTLFFSSIDSTLRFVPYVSTIMVRRLDVVKDRISPSGCEISARITCIYQTYLRYTLHLDGLTYVKIDEDQLKKGIMQSNLDFLCSLQRLACLENDFFCLLFGVENVHSLDERLEGLRMTCMHHYNYEFRQKYGKYAT